MRTQNASAMTSRDDLTQLDAEPGEFAFYAFRNTLVLVWLSGLTEAWIERLHEASLGMHAAHPEGFSNVHLIQAGATLPTPEARKAYVEHLKTLEGALFCDAMVFDGNPFWVSALRSVIAGIRTLAPRSLAIQIQATIDDVLAWLPREHQKRTGTPLDERAFENAMRLAWQRSGAG